jgi:hypothetical protein
MTEFLTLKVLQYFLIPTAAVTGILTGVWLPRTSLGQRRGLLLFVITLVLGFFFIELSYLTGGGVWTRTIFAFISGYIAFGIKLLK